MNHKVQQTPQQNVVIQKSRHKTRGEKRGLCAGTLLGVWNESCETRERERLLDLVEQQTGVSEFLCLGLQVLSLSVANYRPKPVPFARGKQLIHRHQTNNDMCVVDKMVGRVL